MVFITAERPFKTTGDCNFQEQIRFHVFFGNVSVFEPCQCDPINPNPVGQFGLLEPRHQAGIAQLVLDGRVITMLITVEKNHILRLFTRAGVCGIKMDGVDLVLLRCGFGIFDQ